MHRSVRAVGQGTIERRHTGGTGRIQPWPRLYAPGSSASMRRMEFRLLGPLEVIAEGRVVPLDAPKQRALLALLLVRANEPVSRDLLIEELWAGRPPPSATKVLLTYVSQL